MYISDFIQFLYQGKSFLTLLVEIYQSDSRVLVEIENKPKLFTKESDNKYSIIKDGASLLSIDGTTLNQVIEEWKKFLCIG